MRFSGYLLSLLLHLAVVGAAFFWTGPAPAMIDLSKPVYEVQLVSLQAPGPENAPAAPSKAEPAPEKKAEPEPEPEKPKARPLPVKPKPVPAPPKEPERVKKPETKPISPEKVDRAKKPEVKKVEKKPEKKPEPKPEKPPEPTSEELMAEALKEAQQAAKAREARERRQLQSEMASLRREVERSQGTGGVGPGGASGLLQVYGQIVEREIKKNWRYPALGGGEVLVVTIEINIDSSGKITSSKMVTPSGKPDLDASAMRAVSETEQLPPPPTKELRVLRINFNPLERNG